MLPRRSPHDHAHCPRHASRALTETTFDPHLTVTRLIVPALLQRAEEEAKFAGWVQARREETAKKMQELQTCSASKHPIPPCTITPAYMYRAPQQSHLLVPGRWADKKVTLPPTFNKSILDAKMKSVGLGHQVGAPMETAHVLLSRGSGGKGLTGIVPTKCTPQPHIALTRCFQDNEALSAFLFTRQTVGKSLYRC